MLDCESFFEELLRQIKDELGELSVRMAKLKAHGKSGSLELHRVEDRHRRLSNLSVTLESVALECEEVLGPRKDGKPSPLPAPSQTPSLPQPPEEDGKWEVGAIHVLPGAVVACEKAPGNLWLGKLAGVGKSQNEQMCNLLVHIGLRKVCDLCEKQGLLGNKRARVLWVSRGCKVPAKFVWRVKDKDGLVYSIYTNLNRDQKQDLLDELAHLLW